MRSEKLNIDGKEFDAYSISLDPAPFLLIRAAGKSFLACGFLDINAADTLSSCAAKVKGVKTFDDMMAAEVVAVTKEAEKKGVKVGMTGKDALMKF
ncbi:YunC family protein [Methanimicrococcus blatticola]|uniref:Uncharacterized protein YunC (DUF1805 family) n=1 Tax=Methanimicrococcus blatticola TaxID=91560 RepID=A0A484F5J3_9EURY|nr:DUF1805 domain-containing protein [Methanimicrococcus blatticola]MBZ3935799.1 DUF1805 domain-containing protein [Methanimicrococcus blatticola]MCC2508081.1 DUF1805 domain-containing protein [Methanimicrococcus blatticola]TDQ68839.1 uncharacterized protein YunC (DUF1805 family) [Methanimicrococcus blatticola]